ncbi:MAG: GLPGLI family protein [Bacteroidales bacterium]
MKKIITLLTLCGFTFFGLAQESQNSGVVTYDMLLKFELKIQGDQDTEIMKMLPKEKKSKKELVFNQDISLYRNPVKENSEDEVVQESAGGANIVIKMVEPEEFVFFDIKSKKKIEQREFMSRKFLIESNADTIKWKITGNQKEIMGYNCLEAELVGASKKTIAWFAPALTVQTGPDGFTGLPGLILAVDIEEGKMTLTACKIDFKAIDSKELSKPKDGKKVTAQEFKKIVAEKTKDMESSGGATVIIRTED